MDTKITFAASPCTCPITDAFFAPCPHDSQPGILTTDHPASSYGIPVIISESGEAYGPAEARIIELLDRGELGERQWYLVSGFGEAGRWDCKPESAELQMAAQAAGFATSITIHGADNA